MKTATVTGGNGFIGSHLCRRLKDEGYWVRSVDIVPYSYGEHPAHEVIILDVAGDFSEVEKIFIDPFTNKGVDEVYAMACLMGGAGYVFTGEHDADILTKSIRCNLNTVEGCFKYKVGKIFYSSSACCYNHLFQLDPDNLGLTENMAWPAYPDSAYGKEKLFAEDLYLAYNRNHNLNVRIARFHNIFGPMGAWDGGKEKAPAAICRKVLQSNDEIEIWGDGEQTRSFLFVDDCVEGVRRLMQSDFIGPVNIGSEEKISINQLVDIVCSFEGKKLHKKHIEGPLGVRGRTSDNTLIREKLNWSPEYDLREGLKKTYFWIKNQIEHNKE